MARSCPDAKTYPVLLSMLHHKVLSGVSQVQGHPSDLSGMLVSISKLKSELNFYSNQILMTEVLKRNFLFPNTHLFGQPLQTSYASPIVSTL